MNLFDLLLEIFGQSEVAGLISVERLHALYDDINDMMHAEDLSAREAVMTLRNRIRPASLNTYAATLVVSGSPRDIRQ